MSETTAPDVDKLNADLAANQALAAQQAKQAMHEEHGPIAHAAAAMLVARRAYYIVLTSLNRLCQERGLLPEVPQIITDAMAEKALEPFDPAGVSGHVVDTLLKHLDYETQIRSVQQAQLNKEAGDAAEEARRSRDIPVPFPVRTTDLSAGLPRETPLLVSGQEDLVKFWGIMLRAHWARQPGATKTLRVLHLAAEDRNELFTKGKKQLVSIGKNLWGSHATSTKQFDKFVGDWLRRFHDERIDVLLVDNLALFGGPYTGITGPFNKAADGMRVLRRWTESHGCALVAGIPLTTDRLPHDVAESFPGGRQAYRVLTQYAALATTFTLATAAEAEFMRLRLGRFDLQLSNQEYKESLDVDLTSPVVGKLLDQIVAARDALQAGAGVQAERDDEGRDQGGDADSGEAPEVAERDSAHPALHGDAGGSIPGVAEDRLGAICLGGAVGADANEGADVD